MSEKIIGLTSVEAKERIQKYGPNLANQTPKQNSLVSFLLRFKSPLVLLLIAASLISFFTGDRVDSLIIFATILVSVIVDIVQENQSLKAAEKLKQKVAIKIEVLRDAKKVELLASEITIDDTIFLYPGDVVPADVTILETKDLNVNESIITGEAFPKEKRAGDTLLMGTTVINGEVAGKVSRIGKSTEFGRIVVRLEALRPETDFEKGTKQYGLLVVRFVIALVAVIFVVNGIAHHDILGSLIFSLALAVGLAPELLPMIVTVNLSRGAIKMAAAGVIVKHLPAIQNLGSMTVLCTDKTGTLTQNKIILERFENISGKTDEKVLKLAFLNSYFQSNLKNPLDSAILAHQEAKESSWKKLDEIPFDFTRKCLSVIVTNNHKTLLVTKGALENVLAFCNFYESATGPARMSAVNKTKIEASYRELSAKGYRVLAIAYKVLSKPKANYEKEDENQLIYAGLTAFLDPPKPEAKQAIQNLEEKGVKIKILTGDNELVTTKICDELSIKIEGLLTGQEIDKLNDQELSEKVLTVNVFARLTPEQKDRIIMTLRNQKLVVGYLGDGVNDANSLRLADVGISVDGAVDVAKETADMILLTKSLMVLHDGVMEGRKTFANTLKYIFMEMSSNFGNMLSVAIASIFLPFIPMLPTQILLNNLIYDVSQLSIPTDHVDPEQIHSPLHWDVEYIKKFVLHFGPLSSIFDLATFFVLLNFFRVSLPFFRTAWFVESAVTQGLIIFAIRTARTPFTKSRPSLALVLSAFLGVSASVAISQLPIGHLFQFVPLTLPFAIFVAGATATYFILVELAKHWFYSK